MPEVINAALNIIYAITIKKPESKVAQSCHISRAVLSSDGGAVFSEHHIFSVVQLVLNLPVGAV